MKIKVEDFNDNYPNFLQASYSTKVNESAPVGFVLLSVKAIDADAGDNGRVAYFITSGNDQVRAKIYYLAAHFKLLKTYFFNFRTSPD